MFKPSTTSFGNLLVDKWSLQFLESSSTVFESNTKIAIDGFSAFKDAYTKTIEKFFSDKFPGPDEAIRKKLWITEQINLALDLFWEPLARVAEQLNSAPYQHFFSERSELEEALDEFRNNVRNLFGEKVVQSVDKILIYFDKSTRINRYPYTDIALIGIPYRVLTENPRERKTWMPTAHELGHHIYWNMASYLDLAVQKKSFEQGVLEKQKTNDGLSDTIKNMLNPWMGEIFADAIGLQISGSSSEERQAFLDSSKELILRKTDNEKENLSLDDQDHVPDGLRLLVPLVSLDVGNPIAQWHEFLEKVVGKKAENIQFNLRDEDGNLLEEKISATEIADQLCRTVKLILAEVDEFKKGNQSLFKFQSTPLSPTDIANELLEAAKKHGADNPSETLAIALSPEILEGGAGGITHSHTWTTNNPHHHTYTSSHSH